MKDPLGKEFMISYYKISKHVCLMLLIITTNMFIFGHAIKRVNLGKNVKVPAVLVFGDSVVDTGNNDYIKTIAKSNFPPYGRDFPGGVPTGRYSNGRVPSDFVVEELGIKEFVPPYLDPNLKIHDLLTGVSFASGAAGYNPLSSQTANALSLDDQLDLFRGYIKKLKAAIGENATESIISQSLYIICAGSNDITNTYILVSHIYDISTYTGLLVNWASSFLQKLYGLGARRIGVFGVPPCGCLPSQRTIYGGLSRECSEFENQASVLLNNKLSAELNSLDHKLPDSKIVYLDIYQPLLDLITNPTKSGFEVANKGCCGSGKIEVTFTCTLLDPGTCEDASKYVFWDSFHPTQAAYEIIVQTVSQNNIAKFF